MREKGSDYFYSRKGAKTQLEARRNENINSTIIPMLTSLECISFTNLLEVTGEKLWGRICTDWDTGEEELQSSESGQLLLPPAQLCVQT